MVLQVTFHLLIGSETSSTAWYKAAERTLSLVGACVLVQDRLLPEILATLVAFVRFLAGVYPQVLVQYRPLAEGTAAVQTGERFLVGMYPQVLRQVTLLAEPFTALNARIWPRLNVDTAVLQ